MALLLRSIPKKDLIYPEFCKEKHESIRLSACFCVTSDSAVEGEPTIT